MHGVTTAQGQDLTTVPAAVAATSDTVAESLGAAERLRRARERCGSSIEQISKESCVSKRYLQAIEAGQFDKLPELTFAVGFVRAYAIAVNENADEIAALFKGEVRADSGGQTEPAQTRADRSLKRKVPGWLAPLSGLFSLLLTASWIGSAHFTDGVDENLRASRDLEALKAVQAQLDEGVPVAKTVRSLSLVPAAHATTKRVEGEKTVTFTAVRDSWMAITRADGTELWSGILEKGASYTPHIEQGMRLSLSDASAVRLEVAGRALAPLGERGSVAEDVPLFDTQQQS